MARECLVLGAALFAATIVLPASAHAAVFAVNSTTDAVDAAPGNGVCATAGGACTLRAAIQEANALAGADTIKLRPVKYFLSLEGRDEDAAATGDLDITGSLKIIGTGTGPSAVNGGSLDRVFHVIGAIEVTFENLVIQNGLANAVGGGGVLNAGGKVRVSRCSVVDNLAFGTFVVDGGGIYSADPGNSLSLVASSVSNNAVLSSGNVVHGGGVMVHGGGLSISGSRISSNTAVSYTTAACGAGVASSFGSATTITNSRIVGNQATAPIVLGAGAFLGDCAGPTSVKKSTIASNSSSATDRSSGGGVYIYNNPVTMSATLVSGNKSSGVNAGAGGGIYNRGANTIMNQASKVISNFASEDGGGIYGASGSAITVSADSSISRNVPDNISP